MCDHVFEISQARVTPEVGAKSSHSQFDGDWVLGDYL
jgi:hypothetical protein